MTTETSPKPLSVTLEQMAQAFEAWEKGYRAVPSNYLTLDECAALSVSEVSADRAVYFHQLLTQDGC